MWALLPIAAVGLLVAVLTGRRKGDDQARVLQPKVTEEKVSRDNAAMALQLFQSGKRYGVWRSQAGVLTPLMFNDQDLLSQFKALPLNPNQVLYLWDKQFSNRLPFKARARLLS